VHPGRNLRVGVRSPAVHSLHPITGETSRSAPRREHRHRRHHHRAHRAVRHRRGRLRGAHRAQGPPREDPRALVGV